MCSISAKNGANHLQPPVADALQVVRSTETSDLSGGQSRRLKLRVSAPGHEGSREISFSLYVSQFIIVYGLTLSSKMLPGCHSDYRISCAVRDELANAVRARSLGPERSAK